jgi:hypothetical protein
MPRRYRAISQALTVLACWMLAVDPAKADSQAELDAALAKIDMKLYEQSEADVRAWLDARIARYGDFGAYPDLLGHVKIEGDRVLVHPEPHAPGTPVEPATIPGGARDA